MIRTQVQLTEDQVEALRREAAESKVSVSEIVRRAIDAWVEGDRRRDPKELRQRALAVRHFRSGRRDVGVAHDEHLAEAFRR